MQIIWKQMIQKWILHSFLKKKRQGYKEMETKIKQKTDEKKSSFIKKKDMVHYDENQTKNKCKSFVFFSGLHKLIKKIKEKI